VTARVLKGTPGPGSKAARAKAKRDKGNPAAPAREIKAAPRARRPASRTP